MNAIVAVDKNWGIGKDGDQLVYIRADLKRFKELTTGHPVIYGRKTLATFPKGSPLKGRRNLLLSKTADGIPGAEVFHDIASLLRMPSLEKGLQPCSQIIPIWCNSSARRNPLWGAL